MQMKEHVNLYFYKATVSEVSYADRKGKYMNQKGVTLPKCKMKKIIINGGKKLHGSISVSGSKNSSLAILASSMLFEKKSSFKKYSYS